MSDDEIKEYDLGSAYGKVKMTEKQYREHQSLAGDASHASFMEGRAPIAHVGDDGLLDEKNAKAHMRRQDAFTKMFEQMSLKRVKPGSGANIEYVSFDTWRELLAGFWKARKEEKMSEFKALQETGFQPLPTYIRKLVRQTPNGEKQIRPILMNEVGVRPNGVIICLQDRMPSDLGTVVVGPHTKYKDPGRKT